jgi:hypothetical protein
VTLGSRRICSIDIGKLSNLPWYNVKPCCSDDSPSLFPDTGSPYTCPLPPEPEVCSTAILRNVVSSLALPWPQCRRPAPDCHKDNLSSQTSPLCCTHVHALQVHASLHRLQKITTNLGILPHPLCCAMHHLTVSPSASAALFDCSGRAAHPLAG